MALKQLSNGALREFLSQVGAGRTLLQYRRKEPIYAQGDPADAVFKVMREHADFFSAVPPIPRDVAISPDFTFKP